MVPYRGRAALAPPSCSPALERLDLGQHALSVILGRAGLVPSSSPGALCSAAGRGDRDGLGHHRLLQLQGGGHHEQPGARQRARAGRRGEQRRAHARHGPDPRLPARGGRCGQGVLRARRAGRAAAGGECGELVAARAQGPEGDQGRERHLLPRAAQQQQQQQQSPGEARQQEPRTTLLLQAAGRDLVTAQMALLCQDPGDAAATPQLTLAAAVAQRRVIVVKLPYSDLGNLPPLQQLPLKVRMVSSVAVPLETRQLIRRIQRADQLTVAINLQVRAALVLVIFKHYFCAQKNLQDTQMGRDLLESIDLICAGEKYLPPPVNMLLSFLKING